MMDLEPTVSRHKHYMYGRRILDRLQAGEKIRYHDLSTKVQEAVDGMLYCQLLGLVNGHLFIQANLLNEQVEN